MRRMDEEERPVQSSVEEMWATHSSGQCPYNCPVCMMLGLIKQMRPEVAGHIAAAGRELYLAAKAFLDGIAESREGNVRPREE